MFVACQSPRDSDIEEFSPLDPTLELDFRPNILWLVAEDLGPYIPAFGDSTIETPNLDRLAHEGVRYTNVFSPSGVCSPSRAALATGMYPTRIGAHNMQIGNIPAQFRSNPQIMAFIQKYMPEGLDPYEVVPPPEVKLHAEYLRREGYYTTNNWKEDYQFAAPVTAWDESSQTAHWRNRPEGAPFFSIFNFMVTHESQIWEKANDSLWVESDLEVPIPPYLPDTDVVRTDIRRMYSNIKEMDDQVGHLLHQLEEDGLLENTIVVWYTDHGGSLPRQKRLLYDSGLRVPMMIRFPGGQDAGKTDDRLISFIDFKPTLLSISGIEPPAYVDGQAFLGRYKAQESRRYIHAAADRFDEHRDRIRAVRDDRFKYLRNLNTDQGYYLPLSFREQMPTMQELLRLRDAGLLDEAQSQWFRTEKPQEELFDTEADPHELHNLAGDPAYADILAELRAECDRWMAATGDKGAILETELVSQMWPGRVQPVTSPPTIEQEGNTLTLHAETPGASLAYQIHNDGDAPGNQWAVYTEPLTIAEGQTLSAIAIRLGYQQSEVVSR